MPTTKAYREANADKIKAYMKKYHEEHKEEEKQYREDNKERIAKYMKKYGDENREELNEKQKIKLMCECGCEIVKRQMSRHKETKKHTKRMKAKNTIVPFI